MSATDKKQNIEAIFPLNVTQEGLLFHSLTSTYDQGFLNFQCDLKGTIETDFFEKAWNKIVQRHGVLRTTIHWEKIEKPVQIVHKKKSVFLEALDWVDFKPEDQEKQWEALKKKNRSEGVDFTKGALLHVRLVKLKSQTYRLLWTNHHILLDGWSSNNILKEVLLCYEGLLIDAEPSFEVLPSHKSYLRWIGQKRDDEAQEFWSNYFTGLERAHLFKGISLHNELENTTFKQGLTELETTSLKEYAKNSKVTLNTVIQGLWSLVLCRYFDAKDIVHGTTVSGRTSDFPNMDAMTGMFSKVHPVRNAIENDNEPLTEWFAKIQKRQAGTSAFEHLDLDQILPFVPKGVGRSLFDSLLIFENFPIVSSENRTVTVSNLRSGITSTYPVTMGVLPGEELQIELYVAEGTANKIDGKWLLKTFVDLTKLIVSKREATFSSVTEAIAIYDSAEDLSEALAGSKLVTQYEAPRNENEQQLLQIWEEAFQTSGIGIHDNFFDLGGKSMLAVNLFTAINKKMGTKLYPTTLMEHPNVASLAGIFSSGVENTAFKYLVPIKSKGNKAPLFCIHGGGAHVFFFNPLANALEEDRPVYALQPSGIYDTTKMHKSIAAMAQDYAKEIRQVQPKGPYNILVYCFSTAVGIEMALSLKKDGQETNMIIIDSLVDQQNFKSPARVKVRIKGFLNRVLKNPIKALKMGYGNHVQEFLRGKRVDFFGTVDEKNLEKVKRNLIEIYNTYEWKNRYPGKMALLLTAKDDKTLNDIYLKNWEVIADQKVEVIPIEGDHHQLFAEPIVRSMAKSVQNQLV
jgi:thioesterase domain-containing protein